MSDIAIRIDGISKLYTRGKREKYLALRDVLTEALRTPLHLFQGKNGDSSDRTKESFWALKDIFFDVQQGEIVGLIGRNGAGKTTLLKILTRITRPTCGRARVVGRVGSLLEVGTGFHPELTGRENIYFYGSILGMRKKEIEHKFDEIVEFAGTGRFLDTPLKHYSTGMQSRLAFSVAAHLEPEVLLVEFQRKCLGRMEKTAQRGRTVLLVTHQLNQIRRLCKKVVWLDQGRIRMIGPALEVTGAYEAALLARETDGRSQSSGSIAKVRGLRWELEEEQPGNPHVLKSLGPVKVKFLVAVNNRLTMVHAGVSLHSPENQLLWGTAHNIDAIEPGIYEFVYRLDSIPLKPGAYRWRLCIFDEFQIREYWDCSPATRPSGRTVGGHPELPQRVRTLRSDRQAARYPNGSRADLDLHPVPLRGLSDRGRARQAYRVRYASKVLRADSISGR
jgi:lipopolysaccharide transport system ATP-binding protein